VKVILGSLTSKTYKRERAIMISYGSLYVIRLF